MTRSLIERPVARAARLALLGLSLAAALALPPDVAAQATERSAFVTVLDEEGNPVTEVTPADLTVKEDGVTREVLRVVPATTPMELVLLVDNSAATSADTQFIRDALVAFGATLDARHAIGMVTLGDRPTLVFDATTNRETIKRSGGRLFPPPGSGAYLLDAVRETTKGFEKRKPARPVIVAVIREDVEFSTGDHVSLLKDLRETSTAFHAVVLTAPGGDPYIATPEGRERALLVDRGPAETGGRRINLITNLALKDAMVGLAKELNAQVEAVFARPTSLIPPERTTVSSAREGWTARGTLAPPPSQQQ